MSDPVAPLTPAQVAVQEMQAAHEAYLERVLVALDKFVATAAGATPDTTISADAGIAAFQDKGFKRLYGRVMSGFLNLFQRDHGAKAAAGDVAQAEAAISVIEKSGLIPAAPPKQNE